MDQIEHKYVEVNGLKLHVAEIGNGSKTILFCHGFPEIWYSWRHQMIALSKAGFRAIAPDYRGYGLSDSPPVPENTTFLDFANDLHALLHSLGVAKVFLIAKDFGIRVAQLFALLHPGSIEGIVTLGAAFTPLEGGARQFLQYLPEGFYMSRWQEPGRAEADFGRLDPKTVVRNIYILFSRSEIPIAGENQEIMDLVDSFTPLPSWFTEEDLDVYGSLYEKSGFLTALKVPYRSLSEEFNISETKVAAPTLVIMGEKDYVFNFPGMNDYIRSEHGKRIASKLETVYIPEGSHFVQEQFPDQVNELVLNFLEKHS